MRGGLKINSYSEEDREIEPSEKLSPMISQFAKAIIPQNVVEQARSRNAQSFMQQLTSIMTNKPRYATVDDAVKDMQERTGLTVHLENIKSAKNVNKQASGEIPEILKHYDFVDDLVHYIHNNIHNTGGLGISVPSVQHDILSVFPKINPTDIMNEQVSKYISDCIYDEQKMHTAPPATNNLGNGVGKDLLIQDPDPWAGLMPSK
jgi:hypothetical protein